MSGGSLGSPLYGKRPLPQDDQDESDDADDSEVALKKAKLTEDYPVYTAPDDFDVTFFPEDIERDPIIGLDHGPAKIASLSRRSQRLEKLLKFWNEKELKQFYAGIARFGTKDAESISKRVGTKTPLQIGRLLLLLEELSIAFPNDEEPEEAIEIPAVYSHRISKREEERGGRIAPLVRVAPLPPKNSHILNTKDKPLPLPVPKPSILRPNRTKRTKGKSLRRKAKRFFSEEALRTEAAAQRATEIRREGPPQAVDISSDLILHLYAALYPRVKTLIQMSILFAVEREKAALATDREGAVLDVDVQRAIGRAHELEETLPEGDANAQDEEDDDKSSKNETGEGAEEDKEESAPPLLHAKGQSAPASALPIADAVTQ